MWQKRKTKNNLSGSNPLQDILAKGIVAAFSKLQTTFAVFLNKRTADISSFKLKIILLSFCASWMALSVYFIADAFRNSIPHKVLTIHHFKAPKYANLGDTMQKQKESGMITAVDYWKMEQFRKYMDSLKNYSKRSYDSILLSRPGLMDSVTKLEQIYTHQKK